MDWYVYAIRLIEQQTIPVHGASIDRRTMQIVSAACNDATIKALVCFCCGQINTSWFGSTIIASNPLERKSPIVMLGGRWLIERCMGNEESRKYNWEETFFREQYVSDSPSLQKDRYLQEDEWEWRRRIRYPKGMEVNVMCCPTDVISCPESVHPKHIFCQDCAAPLCMKCCYKLVRGRKVPMALANHNFVGYCSETLIKYKVRWIEAAVVCPVWTTMICFYLEEDQGHVMKEDIFGARHRIAVRGNIFSFPMPWAEIMRMLLESANVSELTVPHPPEMLAHMVRLHLNVGTNSITGHMKEVCVRTHVLLQLGYDLIESGHPALMKRSNAGPVPRAAVARIKAAYKRRVETLYPASLDPILVENGVVPPAVASVIEEGRKAKKSASPLFEKNATPSAGATSVQNAFDAVQPQLVVPERSNSAGANTAEVGFAALSRYGDLQIQSGLTFLPQWKPQYLSEAWCFEFPHQTGGPQFRKGESLRVALICFWGVRARH